MLSLVSLFIGVVLQVRSQGQWVPITFLSFPLFFSPSPPRPWECLTSRKQKDRWWTGCDWVMWWALCHI